jgi:hypothetical protein
MPEVGELLSVCRRVPVPDHRRWPHVLIQEKIDVWRRR